MGKCCCSKWFSKLFGAKRECCQKKEAELKETNVTTETSEKLSVDIDNSEVKK